MLKLAHAVFEQLVPIVLAIVHCSKLYEMLIYEMFWVRIFSKKLPVIQLVLC